MSPFYFVSKEAGRTNDGDPVARLTVFPLRPTNEFGDNEFERIGKRLCGVGIRPLRVDIGKDGLTLQAVGRPVETVCRNVVEERVLANTGSGNPSQTELRTIRPGEELKIGIGGAVMAVCDPNVAIIHAPRAELITQRAFSTICLGEVNNLIGE